MEHDPYKIPSSDLTSAETYSGATNVTQRTITELAGTKPWVRLLAVLGFIGSLFNIGIGLFTLTRGMAGSAAVEELAVEGLSDVTNTSAALIFGFVYLIVGLIYIIPSLKLWKFGSAIGRLKDTANVHELEVALSLQRSFWKFLGVMTLIALVLGIVAIIVAGVAVAMAQVSAH